MTRNLHVPVSVGAAAEIHRRQAEAGPDLSAWRQAIRQLLIVGAQTVLLRSKAARSNAWIQGLLARRPRLVVAVALANKMARIVWAVMAQGENYRQAVPA